MDLEILRIASNTENQKTLNNRTHSSMKKNPVCGDEMKISLKVEKNKIIEFGYECKSCIYCQASVSLLSRKSINKPISSINDLMSFVEKFFDKNENLDFPKEWTVFNKLFNKKNFARKECLLLPFKTLSKALKNSNG